MVYPIADPTTIQQGWKRINWGGYIWAFRNHQWLYSKGPVCNAEATPVNFGKAIHIVGLRFSDGKHQPYPKLLSMIPLLDLQNPKP
jgi:hypothetical protein